MKTFEIYSQPDIPNPEEKAVIVKEGFTFFAAFFLGLWTILHRLWLPTLGLVAVSAILYLVEEKAVVSEACANALGFGLFLFVGFEAREWRVAKLKRRGYVLSDIVLASSQDEAMKAYLQQACEGRRHAR